MPSLSDAIIELSEEESGRFKGQYLITDATQCAGGRGSGNYPEPGEQAAFCSAVSKDDLTVG